MRIVVFGLSISSAWGNGHATLLRGLFRELHVQGHTIAFLERDVPYYAANRDAETFPYVELHLYRDWTTQIPVAKKLLESADVAMITSYCPDGAAASELLQSYPALFSIFYDMDTPVTLSRLQGGERVPYLPAEGLGFFDLVLSYTGGAAIERLREQLGAKRVAALYGWVDPKIHHRVPVDLQFIADLSYLGTYSADRQEALQELLLKPALELPDRRFIVAGAMYEHTQTWPRNVIVFDHVAPARHGAFHSSCPLTLNITRGTMAAMGYCPSGRLFEATACGTAVVSDTWEGIETFFQPGSEILLANGSTDSIRGITAERGMLAAIGRRAQERTLDCHTAGVRAKRLLDLIEKSPEGTASEVRMLASSVRE